MLLFVRREICFRIIHAHDKGGQSPFPTCCFSLRFFFYFYDSLTTLETQPSWFQISVCDNISHKRQNDHCCSKVHNSRTICGKIKKILFSQYHQLVSLSECTIVRSYFQLIPLITSPHKVVYNLTCFTRLDLLARFRRQLTN